VIVVATRVGSLQFGESPSHVLGLEGGEQIGWAIPAEGIMGGFTAHVIATFPEYQGMEVEADGEGSSNRIAIVRAIRQVLYHPNLKHKSPNWINLAVSTGGIIPLRYLPKRQDK
jgi:hypothetical protein